MSYRVTEYSPRFKDQIAALRCRVFGGTQAFAVKYFTWKYEQNPYLKEQPLFYIALHEGNVVGMLGAYGSQWRAGRSQKSWIIPCSAEFAVDPDHQRHGLGQQLSAYKSEDTARKGYKYSMHLSANRSSLRLQPKLQFERVATYHSFQRGIERTLLARGRRKLKRLIGSRQIETPFRNFDIWAAQSSGSIIGALEPRISEMSDLVSRYCSESATRHARDTCFYRWRFADPSSVYRFIFYVQGGSMAGFFVLHQSTSGGRTTIVDWETSTQVAWSKLLHAVAESNAQNLVITSTAFSEGQTQTLLRMGFESVHVLNTATNPAPGIFLWELANNSTVNGDLDFRGSPSSSKLDVRMICSDAF